MHIEELRNEKHSSQNLQGQNIEKEIVKSKDEIRRLNKILKDKDEEMLQIQKKIECSELKVGQHQQHIKELKH